MVRAKSGGLWLQGLGGPRADVGPLVGRACGQGWFLTHQAVEPRVSQNLRWSPDGFGQLRGWLACGAQGANLLVSGLGSDMVGVRTVVVLGLVGDARLGLVLAHW